MKSLYKTYEYMNLKELHKKEWSSWFSMKQRCNNPHNVSYAKYGGVGITYVKDWESFKNFYRDMGDKPSALHTLDRIDNTKGYSIENCRWATKKEQATNRSTTNFIKFEGQEKSIQEWMRVKGLTRMTYNNRLNLGWDLDKIFNTKLKNHKY